MKMIKIRKFISLVMLLILSISINSYATSMNTKEEIDSSMYKNCSTSGKIPLVKSIDDKLESKVNSYNTNNQFTIDIPDKVDMRDYNGVNYITDSKNQSIYGTCYAFAANAASEANLVKEGIVDRTISLSEASLSYRANYRYGTEDELGNTIGDRSEDFNYDIYQDGGSALDALYTYSNWIGPVTSKDWSYSYLLYNEAKEKGNLVSPYENDVAHLENGYAVVVGKNATTIKQLILEYGAADASVYMDTKNCKKQSDGTYSLYTPGYNCPNHDICIIGWDDNFSKSNFINTPSIDGAWLVKNSWGSLYQYIWISYEELSTNNCNAYIFDFGNKDNYDHLYQYDGTGNNFYVWIPTGSSISHTYKINNSSSETLEAISLFIWNENVNYSIQVYKNSNNTDPTSGIPMLSSPYTGTIMYAGFNTIKLPTSIPFNNGDTFSIVITLNSNYDYNIGISAETTFNDNSCIDGSLSLGQVFYKDAKNNNFEDMYYGSESLKGSYTFRLKAYTKHSNYTFYPIIQHQSTCTEEGLYEWIDSNDNENSYKYDVIIPTSAHTYTRKNICKEALKSEATIYNPAIYYFSCENCNAINIDDTKTFMYGDKLKAVSKIVINKPKNTILAGKTLQLNATCIPIDANNKNILWTTNNPKIATVTSNGLVKAINAGTVKITAKTTDGSNIISTCKLTVKPLVKYIKTNKKTITIHKRKTYKIKIKCFPKNAYQEVSFNSKNKSIATVNKKGIIKAKKKGTTKIICKAKDGSNKKLTIKLIVK